MTALAPAVGAFTGKRVRRGRNWQHVGLTERERPGNTGIDGVCVPAAHSSIGKRRHRANFLSSSYQRLPGHGTALGVLAMPQFSREVEFR